MNETWLPVEGHGDRYEVSDQGRVRRAHDGYVLREEPIVGGYRRVTLSDHGRARKKLVHCIVAATFIGPRPEGHEVDHEDGQPHHNAASNLRYLTPSQNVRASFDRGERVPAHGEGHAQAKFTDELVTSIRLMAQEGATTRWLADLFAVNYSTIERIVKRKTWRHLPA